MSPVSIGRLDRRLTLERVARSDDGGGGSDEIWKEVGPVWAAVKTPSGTESLQGDGLKGRLQHEIVIRWRSDLTPAMRFRDGARILAIRAVCDPDGRRRWLRCICEECVA